MSKQQVSEWYSLPSWCSLKIYITHRLITQNYIPTYLNSKILKLLSSRFRLFDMVWRGAWSCLLLAMIFFYNALYNGARHNFRKKNQFHKKGLLTDVWFICVSCHFGRSSNFEIDIECRNIDLPFCFLFPAGSKRRVNHYASFVMKSLNLFYIFKVLQITFHNNIKKTSQLIFNTNFNIQQPVRMTWATISKTLCR